MGAAGGAAGSRRSRPGRQRYCRCGTCLAADNIEQQCARCQRASRDKFVAPPEVPAEFWQGEPLREAFVAQHIGRVIRAYRMSPHHHAVHGPTGIAQGLLGQWFGLSQSQISKIETGPPILSLDTLRHWARVLCIPQEWLWFDLSGQGEKSFRSLDDTDDDVVPAPGSAAGPTVSSHVSLGTSFLGGNLDLLLQLAGEDGEEMMKRRAFVQAVVLARLGLGVGGTAAILEAVRHELDRSVADERGAAGVDEWQAIALDYGQTYLVTAPATLLQTLLVDLHGVQLAMQRHSGEQAAQRELVRVGALLAVFTAHTVADLGDLVAARRWWRSARRAADESADPFTVFWVRGREVVRAGYERRPVEATLRLVDEAEARFDLKKAPPAVLSEFWSGKAQTLALAGRHGEAERVMYQVRELPVSAAHRDSLFDYAEENLRYTESFVYSHAGSFAEAEQAQQAALALYTDSNLRDAAQIELQRALCLVRSGDFAQGAGHAQTVITDLPVIHRERPFADLGQKVLDAIPAKERRRSWAQEYRECLESSLPGGAGNSLPGTARA